MNKYEQLVEFIINDENDKARALFHAIVVEKSRDIYESLVEEEDLDETIGGNEVEDLVDEVSLDEEGISEEEEEFGAEEEDGAGEFGGEEEVGEEEIEDRVLDLESALDELKAEFDALMADEAHEPEHHDGIDDPDFGGEEEYGSEEGAPEEFYESEEDDEEEDDEEELDESIVREYVEKVGDTGQHSESGKMAGTGARTPASGGKQTKSSVAGKNPIGAGSASGRNIATGKANQNPDGSSPAKANNEYTKGEGKLPDAGNFKNVPGNKKVWDQKGPADGHGAEKVGEKEGKLAGNDGRRPVNTKSTLKPRA